MNKLICVQFLFDFCLLLSDRLGIYNPHATILEVAVSKGVYKFMGDAPSSVFLALWFCNALCLLHAYSMWYFHDNIESIMTPRKKNQLYKIFIWIYTWSPVLFRGVIIIYGDLSTFRESLLKHNHSRTFTRSLSNPSHTTLISLTHFYHMQIKWKFNNLIGMRSHRHQMNITKAVDLSFLAIWLTVFYIGKIGKHHLALSWLYIIAYVISGDFTKYGQPVPRPDPTWGVGIAQYQLWGWRYPSCAQTVPFFSVWIYLPNTWSYQLNQSERLIYAPLAWITTDSGNGLVSSLCQAIAWTNFDL